MMKDFRNEINSKLPVWAVRFPGWLRANPSHHCHWAGVKCEHWPPHGQRITHM